MEAGLVVAGKYMIVQLIGEGGMGAVYDAIHVRTGRRVALKLIHEGLMTSPRRRERFEREARSAAAIDSLHVVQVLDYGEDENSRVPFLVMEFLQGEDLQALVRRGRFPARLAVAIALQISRGLRKVHEAGLVHRDLKPANVFITKGDDDQRVAKILDFGVAKVIEHGDAAAANLSATADVIGSPAYMSPEQLSSPRDVDERSDVWALGVVLFEMIASRPPTTDEEPIGRRVYAICHQPAPSLDSLVPSVSPDLAALVHRALEIDATKRFQTIEEMAAALRALETGGIEIVEADVAALSESAPPVADSERAPPKSAERPTRSAAKGRLVVAGLAALTLVAVSAAVVAMAPKDAAPRPGRTAAQPPVVPVAVSSVAVLTASGAPPRSATTPPDAPAPASASGRPMPKDPTPSPVRMTTRPVERMRAPTPTVAPPKTDVRDEL